MLYIPIMMILILIVYTNYSLKSLNAKMKNEVFVDIFRNSFF